MMQRKSNSGKQFTPRQFIPFGQTNSQQMQEENFQQTNIRQKQQWYQQLCSNKINQQLPSYIPTYKRSQPYKFIISKIHNISFTKKSSQSHQFINIQALFITDKMQIIGKKVIYQCQQAIIQGKQEYPIVFYYHSKVNRNFSHLKILLNINLIQQRNACIESFIKLGTALIDQPFIQKQIKSATIYKDCSQIDLLTNYSTVSFQPASSYFSYRIQSFISFKVLAKVIPSQCIVCANDHICGIFNGYLPSHQQNDQIIEGYHVFLKICYLRIDICEEFQTQIMNSIKKIPQFSQFVSPKITSRKLILGFHNQFQFVTPSQRKLQLLKIQRSARYHISQYQIINQNQLVKIPFYVDQENMPYPSSALAASLIFQINGIQIQVAIFLIDPKTNGQKVDISKSMITGPGKGLKTNLINVGTIMKPTIIIQYYSEENLTGRTDEMDIKGLSRQLFGSHFKRSIKNTKQITQGEIRQNQKILEQVEKQKLQLLKQRQYIEELKSQNFSNIREQFDKKLQEEKQQLWKRQNLLQQHYRQEVQRQFQMKIQMQKQIRQMKQRLAVIQNKEKQDFASKKLSYDQTPQVNQSEFVQTGGFAAQYNEKINPRQFNQKVNARQYEQQKKKQVYVQDQQSNQSNQIKQFPLKNIRKQQDIENQYKQFNHASKFTFTFTSIVWTSDIWPPKSFLFLIKFFNFHDFKTDILACIEGQNHYQQIVKQNYQANIQGQKQPIYCFTVDPSRSRNPKILHQDLVNYLVNEYVIVEVLTQNFLQVGRMKIPMQDLLRSSKAQVLVAKQAHIIRDKQVMGTVQMLIKNQKQACFQISGQVDHKKMKTELKKKVISNPINIALNMPKQNEGESYQKKKILSRQELRIQNYKKQTALKTNSFNEQKRPQLNRVNQYKQKKMPQIINKINRERK